MIGELIQEGLDPDVKDTREALGLPDLQGYLRKAPYGNLSMFGMLRLKKRYFVLHGHHLCYYATDEDYMVKATPLGKIQIDPFTTVTEVDGLDVYGIQLKISGEHNAGESAH